MVSHSEDRPETATTSPTLAARIGAEISRQLATSLEAGLHLVATPIGNLGDISIRALTALLRADVIYCEDTRHSRTLLSHYGIDRPLRPYHEHNASAERPRILAQLGGRRAIALISDAGTPLISDPGYKLVREALEAGHKVTALPGASSVLAGLSMAGLPTDTFLFAGFLPPKDGARRTRLLELAPIPATLILFEAPTRLPQSLRAIADTLGDREVAVARELTKRFEQLKRGSARALADWSADEEVKGEIVLIIGPRIVGEIGDDAVAAELAKALPLMSFKDAVRAVSDSLGVPRSRVYDIGLMVKSRDG